MPFLWAAAAKVIETVIMYVRDAALWEWVASIWAFITGWVATVYATFVTWITPLVLWLQTQVEWLWFEVVWYLTPLVVWLQTLYTTYVVPTMVFLTGLVTWLQVAVLLIQGKLEGLITFVYDKIFHDVEELRANIIKVSDTLKDVASIFSKDLAVKIQLTEDKTLRLLDSYTRDIRDWAISTLHEATDPLIRKTNEISILLNGFINQVQDRFKPIENLIAITFEKPGVLKRDTVRKTSQTWGVDLWNDLFSGVTPKVPITPSLERIRLQVDPVVDKYINDLFAEKLEGWRDVSLRIDEEIRERWYGEIIPVKTQITVPKLPKGAGGKF